MRVVPDRETIDVLLHAMVEEISSRAVQDMAGHVGDQVHAVLKRHATMMPTTVGAIATGVLTGVLIISETREFARLSMDGEAEDERAITAAFARLFVDLLPPEFAQEIRDHAAGFPHLAQSHAGEAVEHDPRAGASPDQVAR